MRGKMTTRKKEKKSQTYNIMSSIIDADERRWLRLTNITAITNVKNFGEKMYAVPLRGRGIT